MIIPIKEQSGEEKRITLYKTNAFVDALVLFFFKIVQPNVFFSEYLLITSLFTRPMCSLLASIFRY